MIRKVQDVYPSSNVSQEVIDDYGWELVEELPVSIFSPNQGRPSRVSPTPEASEYLRDLRRVIDEVDTLRLGTEAGVIEIKDFAVARIETDLLHQGLEGLGFFALLPK